MNEPTEDFDASFEDDFPGDLDLSKILSGEIASVEVTEEIVPGSPESRGDRWIEYVSIDELVAADRNPKKHADEVIQESYDEFGYTEPILLDERTGKLVAGHGRTEGLFRRRANGQAPPAGVTEDWKIAVTRGWASRDDAHAEKYLIMSNRAPEVGGWDYGELFEILDDHRDDLTGLGYTAEHLDEIEEIAKSAADGSGLGGSPEESSYSKAINVPQYEPTGAKPKIEELFDDARTQDLAQAIQAADIPVDLRNFLLTAASRHTAFEYRKIAEFYAHASPDVQRLFEESALVIIDPKDAIRLGYAQFEETIEDLREADAVDA